MRVCTLLFLVRDDQILLAMKKRDFGKGYWCGVGGKVLPGETIEHALIRECQEEISVTPVTFEAVALHDFRLPDGSPDMTVHTYVCDTWQGDPMESEEMAPQWFSIDSIPYDTMWQDDRYWLPQVLEGKKLRTVFIFDKTNTMLSRKVHEVEALA